MRARSQRLKHHLKMLPPATTFADALHQAGAVEDQDMLPRRLLSQNQNVGSGESEKEPHSKHQTLVEEQSCHICHICHSSQHRAYECPQCNALSEASGCDCSK